jgi:hypothetical protein
MFKKISFCFLLIYLSISDIGLKYLCPTKYVSLTKGTMKTKTLVILILFLALFAMAPGISVDTDTWWHLATGKYILENRSIPSTDIFSHTRANQPWMGANVGWIMQIILYVTYSVLNFGGLNILTAGMITLAFIFIYRSMPGGVFLRAFIIVLSASTAGVYWAARPYLMSFVLSAITIWVLEDFRWERKDRLWLLPPIMMVWANSHGGWAYGPLLWGLYGLGDGITWLNQARLEGTLIPQFSKKWLLIGIKGRVGRMLLIGFLMAVAICINPAGPKMLLYPFQTVSIGVLQDFIVEWQSPNFHTPQMQPFAWILLLTVGIVGASNRRINHTDFILFSGLAYMSLLAGRNIAIFALAAAPILSRYAEPLAQNLGNAARFYGLSDRQPTRFQSILNIFLLLLTILTVFIKTAASFPPEITQESIQAQAPVGAVAYLKTENRPGNIFNAYNWGGYLIWHLPEYPVFVDGRTDLYADQILEQWFDIALARPGWQEKLDGWQISLVLLHPDLPIVLELAHTEEWKLLYQDEISVLYGR